MNNDKRLLRSVIRGVDKAMSNCLLIVLALLLLFCLYVLAENQRIVAKASNLHFEAYKPTADDTVSFDQLCRDNPDVIGWITIDDTNIDYPLVQGATNDTYVNTDVFGDFSLSGALFLDFRNHTDPPDPLSIIYGHNMTGDAMFGGIHLFSDKDYFDAHRSGTLLLGGVYYKLEIVAFAEANGHDTRVYDPGVSLADYPEWRAALLQSAAQVASNADTAAPAVLLSTCAEGRTDQRKLLLATLRPGGAPPAQKTETGGLKRFVVDLFSADMERYYLEPWFWLSILLLVILTALNIRYRRRCRKKRKAAENDA